MEGTPVETADSPRELTGTCKSRKGALLTMSLLSSRTQFPRKEHYRDMARM